MFDELVAGTTATHGAGAVDAWARVESAACANRLAAMVTMLDTAYAADGSTHREQWCIDNWAAVCAHIGATQRLTSGAASGLLLVGTALRDRFPKVAAVFADGVIGYPLVRTIVYRALNVTDPAALRALDRALAHALRTWEPMLQDKTEKAIDAAVCRVDPHAVRRTQLRARGRSLDISIDDASGVATLFGTMFAHDATAFDRRLTAIAATVCPADPRTTDQCRADAAGAMALGADRLPCLCGDTECPAAQNPPASAVVVYLVAHGDTLDSPPARDGQTAPLPDGDQGGSSENDGSENCASDAELGADRYADPDAECADLDGAEPPLFDKPLREMTLIEALTDDDPGHLSTIRPGALLGGQLVPGSVTRRAARHAKVIPLSHPGQAPPEPRYRPSTALAAFVRCRDDTCRFPGCRVPATDCDIDHTIPWPLGPTLASNLKALCRRHHLLKTFWGGENGWRDRQEDDGTVIWTGPDGRRYATEPGSRLLFPALCAPTATVRLTGTPPPAHTNGLTMPRRRRTRAQDRALRIRKERELTKAPADARTAGAQRIDANQIDPDEPPPF